MRDLNEIRKLQVDYQKLAGFPIDTISATERNEVAEKYLFKLIEEVVELRKEFPSVMNPWSKSQKREDVERVKEELSDCILFLINFMNVWRFSTEEVLETLTKIQDNNFAHLKRKRMHVLNCEILKVPDTEVCIGQGELSPKYLIVGQNPGRGIVRGYEAWKIHETLEESPRSTKVLRSKLQAINVDHLCYFTNLVKVSTEDNVEPSPNITDYWKESFAEELEILSANNAGMKVVALGNWTSARLTEMGIEHIKITHPSAILRSFKTEDEYLEEIKSKL